MNRQIVRVASYALIVKDDSMLLCRLAPHEASVGLWTLPGGGLDFGEHPEEAAVREVYEETGLKVRLTGLAMLNSEVHPCREGEMHSLRFLYWAEVEGGTLTHEAWGSTDMAAFVPLAELSDLRMVPTARLGVDLVQAR